MDELTKPLGLDPPRKPRRGRFALIVTTAVVAVVVGGSALWLTRTTAPNVTVATAAVTPAQVKTQQDPTVTGSIQTAPTQPAAAPSQPVATTTAGLTQVQPSGALTNTGKVRIYDPSSPAPLALPATPDGTLVEKSAYGLLPKVGPDGRRPLDAYARPAPVSSGGARIAIVVGGVGVDPTSTQSAIVGLPGPVTLAMAPYGTTLPQDVASARAAGHELLLQVPLEPYGYPATNPGPHTLTVNGGTTANLDNLNWLLSRTSTYIGVVNYMGAAFTNSSQPMAALLDAVGQRGLLYLDDGSSARSLAATLAPGHAPFLQADIVLDPDLTPAAIDARLDQLVAIARQRGYAIATATAFPASIDRIANFAKNAGAKDVTLVPLSALVAASPS